jgi:hypothetical protein
MAQLEKKHEARIRAIKGHGDYRIGNTADRAELDEEIAYHTKALVIINGVKKVLADKARIKQWKDLVAAERLRYKDLAKLNGVTTVTPFTDL